MLCATPRNSHTEPRAHDACSTAVCNMNHQLESRSTRRVLRVRSPPMRINNPLSPRSTAHATAPIAGVKSNPLADYEELYGHRVVGAPHVPLDRTNPSDTEASTSWSRVQLDTAVKTGSNISRGSQHSLFSTNSRHSLANAVSSAREKLGVDLEDASGTSGSAERSAHTLFARTEGFRRSDARTRDFASTATLSNARRRPGCSAQEIAQRLKIDDTGAANVYLRVYDLSQGRFGWWSKVLLGQDIGGMWHTGVEVNGELFQFFGGQIICSSVSHFDSLQDITPDRKHFLGVTHMTRGQLLDYLSVLAERFTCSNYDIIEWNCNHFSDHVCKFLVERSIPQYIRDVPAQVMSVLLGRVAVNFVSCYYSGSGSTGGGSS
eukprot:Lankesteria_metandrocarpae@DN4927_c0_g1_i1.p1